MIRWRHYHNVTKLLPDSMLSPRLSGLSRFGSYDPAKCRMSYDTAVDQRLNCIGISLLCHPFIAKLKEQTRPRGVGSGARSRPAAGVGLFAPMPTPLRNRQRFRMRTVRRDLPTILRSDTGILGHNMITNTAYSTGKPPYSISPYSSSGRRIFSDADVGGAAASD